MRKGSGKEDREPEERERRGVPSSTAGSIGGVCSCCNCWGGGEGGQDEQPLPASHCPHKPTPAQRGQDQPEGQQQGCWIRSERKGSGKPTLHSSRERGPISGRGEQQQPEQEHPASPSRPQSRQQEGNRQAAGTGAPAREEWHRPAHPTYLSAHGALPLFLIVVLVLLLHPPAPTALSNSP